MQRLLSKGKSLQHLNKRDLQGRSNITFKTPTNIVFKLEPEQMAKDHFMVGYQKTKTNEFTFQSKQQR